MRENGKQKNKIKPPKSTLREECEMAIMWYAVCSGKKKKKRTNNLQ